MICPNCSSEMKLSHRHGVDIDFCPSCKGVWLDRGELEKIAGYQDKYDEDHFKKYHFGKDNYDRDDDNDDDYYKKRKSRKRGGFFGEFFDFD